MLQKSFTEGIFLERPMPQSFNSFKSTCQLTKERSYCTSIYFVPKLIPKRSFLTINGATEDIETVAAKASATYNRKCSMSNGSVKSYESSISMEQEERTKESRTKEVMNGLDCQQNIELVPGLVMTDYSESINIFPKTYDKSYKSDFAYDDSYRKRNYIVGLKVDKVREVILTDSEENSMFTSSVRLTTEDTRSGDLHLNGDCDDFL